MLIVIVHAGKYIQGEPNAQVFMGCVAFASKLEKQNKAALTQFKPLLAKFKHDVKTEPVRKSVFGRRRRFLNSR